MKNNFTKLVRSIDWQKTEGLIPAIIQNVATGQVIMLGYMDKQALKKTFETKRVWFYSRTKKRLWMKGETSKNVLKVVDVMTDCDNDTLLIKVEPTGPICHTGSNTCFKNDSASNLTIIAELFELIKNRKIERPKGSYTTTLFDKGLDKIGEKIYEEAAEVVRAAKKETKKRLIEESVDLLYHLFVFLIHKEIELNELISEIVKRRK